MQRITSLLPLFLIAILCGTGIASVVIPPSWFILLLSLLSLVTLFVGILKKKPLATSMAVLLIGTVFGVARYGVWDTAPLDPMLERSIGDRVVLSGVVIEEPDVREGKARLTLALSRREEGDASREVFGRALVTVNRFPEYRYGDELLLSGKLMLPEAIKEDDGRVFDYPSYLRAKGVDYRLSFPRIELLSQGKGNSFVATLYRAKSRFMQAIDRAVPSPESALLSGLLLGGKRSLGEEWLERFRIAGIVHIVVLSGYNMTVIAEWLVVIFSFLGFYASLSAGAMGILLFSIAVGGGATVVRAAIMACIVLLAKATGRSYDMGRALLFAGTAMVLHDPGILAFDPSFQLSFLASLGLVFASPVLERKIRIFRDSRALREVLVSTLATQVLVLPLLLYQTGMLSLVALPVNLIVLPLVPISMLLGFAASMLALLVPSLAFLFGLPVYLLLHFIMMTAEYAALVPYAAVSVGNVPVYVVILLYLVIALVLYREKRRTSITSPASIRRALPSN